MKKWGAAASIQKVEESKVINDLTSTIMTFCLEGKARSFARIKLPKQIYFSSLREILQPNNVDGIHCWNAVTLYTPSDLDKSFDPIRQQAVMSSMLALDEFVTKYRRLPSRSRKVETDDGSKHKRTDVERFQSCVNKIAMNDGELSTSTDTFNSLVTQFAQMCRAKFVPVQALAGALGAQETLKVATGLYNPIHQFLIYDCDEVLQGSEAGIGEARIHLSATAPGMSYILGETTSNKLALARLFLVGAGAIGRELLKKTCVAWCWHRSRKHTAWKYYPNGHGYH